MLMQVLSVHRHSKGGALGACAPQGGEKNFVGVIYRVSCVSALPGTAFAGRRRFLSATVRVVNLAVSAYVLKTTTKKGRHLF